MLDPDVFVGFRAFPWIQFDETRASRALRATRAFHLVPSIDGASQVRDDDAAADNETDAHGLEHFVARHAFLGAAHYMVGDAIVAAKHHRRDEPEQFLRLHIERTVFVRAAVEIEEAIDDEIVLAQDPRVHALAKLAELRQGAGSVATIGVAVSMGRGF